MENQNVSLKSQLIQKHNAMIITLSSDLTDKEVDDLKSIARRLLGFGRGELQEVKSVSNLVDLMCQRKKIVVDSCDYDRLIDILKEGRFEEQATAVEDKISEMKQLRDAYAKRKQEGSDALSMCSPDAVKAFPDLPFKTQPAKRPKNFGSSDGDSFLQLKRQKGAIEPDGSKDIPSYDLTSPGLVVIFNNFVEMGQRRQGTEKDEQKISEFFMGSLLYEVHAHRDKTKTQLLECWKQELQKAEGRGFSCLFVFIMSHGGKDGIETIPEDGNEEDGSDRNILKISELEKDFEDSKEFLGKPKIFIIQACQGEDSNCDSVRSDSFESEEIFLHEDVESDAMVTRVPKGADTLIAYAATHGYKSFRHPEEGSWYIQGVIATVKEYYQRTDLLSMLTIAQQRVSHRRGMERNKKVMQMPVFVSTLRQQLHLRSC